MNAIHHHSLKHTLSVPYRAKKVYGESICDPLEKAWLIWKSG